MALINSIRPAIAVEFKGLNILADLFNGLMQSAVNLEVRPFLLNYPGSARRGLKFKRSLLDPGHPILVRSPGGAAKRINNLKVSAPYFWIMESGSTMLPSGF